MYLMNLKSLRMLIYLSGLISVFLIIYYIYISNYNKNILKQNERKINFLMMQQQRGKYDENRIEIYVLTKVEVWNDLKVTILENFENSSINLYFILIYFSSVELSRWQWSKSTNETTAKWNTKSNKSA